MLRWLPKSRMGIFTAILVILWLLKAILLSSDAQQTLSPGQQLSIDLLTLLLMIPATYYICRLFALVRRKLLWKISRRLILAHIFIGAIPVVLVAVILSGSALLFYYQLSYYLVSNQIGIHAGQIHAFNHSLRTGLEQMMADRTVDPAQLSSAVSRDIQYLLGAYPTATIVVRFDDPTKSLVTIHSNMTIASPDQYQIPGWLGEREFSGLVVEDFQPGIHRAPGPRGGAKPVGRLFLRSLVFSDLRPDAPFSIELSVPFDGYLLYRLKAALGQDLLLADRAPIVGLNVMLLTTDILQKNISSATFEIQSSVESAGHYVWSIILYPVSWNSGMETRSSDAQVLFVKLSTSELFQNLFRSESDVSQTILGGLQIVVGFFLLVEIISIIIGIMLTMSITNAVFNLDRGTQFIKRGDFSHRIMLKSNDQLGALAESFNQMTAYVQALVKERVQKERLERELEIAKEVQEQLFPRAAPQIRRMDLTGLCLPARVVSGDYYDFLYLSVDKIGLALGDICGKGISAALLMANLQATLRSNVTNSLGDAPRLPDRWDGKGHVSGVVRRINEQISQHTAANKFASFFYALYDDRQFSLTYCNAGHNPPLFVDGRECRRLSTGGTVVGIFPDAEYAEEVVELHPGDLLLAYTDGISESVNEYGEEFGEERLAELVFRHRGLPAEQIQKIIVEQALEWSFEEERDDDMTLIVAKFR